MRDNELHLWLCECVFDSVVCMCTRQKTRTLLYYYTTPTHNECVSIAAKSKGGAWRIINAVRTGSGWEGREGVKNVNENKYYKWEVRFNMNDKKIIFLQCRARSILRRSTDKN